MRKTVHIAVKGQETCTCVSPQVLRDKMSHPMAYVPQVRVAQPQKQVCATELEEIFMQAGVWNICHVVTPVSWPGHSYGNSGWQCTW